MKENKLKANAEVCQENPTINSDMEVETEIPEEYIVILYF
jgi:hypothetical protein